MPMPSEMGISFTPTEIQDIRDHLNGILTIMNNKKVVQLTATERQAAQSASEKRFPYIQNAIKNLAPAFPNLQPNFLKLSDAEIDYDQLYEHCLKIATQIESGMFAKFDCSIVSLFY